MILNIFLHNLLKINKYKYEELIKVNANQRANIYMYGYINKNVITYKSLNNTSLSSVVLVDLQY